MSTTGEPPVARREMLELIARGLLTQAVVVAARLGIADLVADRPRSAAELAEATGTRPDALARLLRALVALGVLARADDVRLSATPLSRALEDGPGSIRALAAFVGAVTWRPWGALGHSVASGEPAFRHEYGEGLFEHLGHQPEAARIFQAWMTEQSRLHVNALLGVIDLAGVERLVDVGGGRGTLLAALLEANPGLRGALYDLPEVASTAAGARRAGHCRSRRGGGRRLLRVGPRGRRPLPVLKLVIHDWDDERAIRILDSVRRAIPSRGRLLLVEHLLPEGDGYDHAVWLDLNMLVMTDGGRERTVAEYRDLARPGGLPVDPSPPDVRPHERDRRPPRPVGSRDRSGGREPLPGRGPQVAVGQHVQRPPRLDEALGHRLALARRRRRGGRRAGRQRGTSARPGGRAGRPPPRVSRASPSTSPAGPATAAARPRRCRSSGAEGPRGGVVGEDRLPGTATGRPAAGARRGGATPGSTLEGRRQARPGRAR